MALSRPLLLATAAVLLASVATAALVPVTVQEGPDQVPVPAARVGDKGTYAFFAGGEEPIGLWTFEIADIEPTSASDGSTVRAVVVRSAVNSAPGNASVEDHVDLSRATSVRLDAGQARADFEEVLTGFRRSTPILPGLPLAGSTLYRGHGTDADAIALDEGIAVPWWTSEAGERPRLSYEIPGSPRGEGTCTVQDTPRVPRGGSLGHRHALQVVVQTSCGGEQVEWSSWFTSSAPVAAYVAYPASHRDGPSVVAALVHFEQGQGERIDWAEGDTVLQPAPEIRASDHGSGPPPTGNQAVLRYPIEAALEDVHEDDGLLSFQVWRQTHQDAQVASARLTRGEHSWDGLETYTWRFVFASSDGSGYQVATELYRANGTVRTSDRGPLDVPGAALDQPRQRTITIAQAIAQWRSVASEAYDDAVPNYVHWGLDVPLTWADDCDHIPEDTGLIPSGPGMDEAVVGYSSYGTCVTPKVERRESYARVGLANGTVASLVEHRLRLAAFPDGEVDRADVSAARPVPEGEVIEPPRLEVAAVTTTSLLALLWGAYFWPVLKFALARAVVVVRGFTRIPRSDLLEHPTRESIVQLLVEEPGLTASEVTEALEIGWSTLAHHTRLLEDANLVETRLVGRHRHFFVPGTVEPDERQAVALLRNENTRRVYEQMTETPGLPLADLAEQLDMTPAGALWHVHRLEDAGLATRERSGREVLCIPRSAPEEAV